MLSAPDSSLLATRQALPNIHLALFHTEANTTLSPPYAAGMQTEAHKELQPMGKFGFFWIPLSTSSSHQKYPSALRMLSQISVHLFTYTHLPINFLISFLNHFWSPSKLNNTLQPGAAQQNYTLHRQLFLFSDTEFFRSCPSLLSRQLGVLVLSKASNKH